MVESAYEKKMERENWKTHTLKKKMKKSAQTHPPSQNGENKPWIVGRTTVTARCELSPRLHFKCIYVFIYFLLYVVCLFVAAVIGDSKWWEIAAFKFDNNIQNSAVTQILWPYVLLPEISLDSNPPKSIYFQRPNVFSVRWFFFQIAKHIFSYIYISVDELSCSQFSHQLSTHNFQFYTIA